MQEAQGLCSSFLSPVIEAVRVTSILQPPRSQDLNEPLHSPCGKEIAPMLKCPIVIPSNLTMASSNNILG